MAEHFESPKAFYKYQNYDDDCDDDCGAGDDDDDDEYCRQFPRRNR